jgi:hypothetical protein
MPCCPAGAVQAQGLVHLMGGVGFVHQAVRVHNVVLAAHGPYTAAGAANVLGVPVSGEGRCPQGRARAALLCKPLKIELSCAIGPRAQHWLQKHP